MSTNHKERQLNVLWRLRRQDEDATRLAFEVALTRVDAAETQVRRLRGLLDAHNAEVRRVALADPVAMARYRASAAELTAALSDANRFLAEARVDLEHKRSALQRAMHHRKAAETVRRRHAAAAAEARDRQETRAADDLHGTRLTAGAAESTTQEPLPWATE